MLIGPTMQSGEPVCGVVVELSAVDGIAYMNGEQFSDTSDTREIEIAVTTCLLFMFRPMTVFYPELTVRLVAEQLQVVCPTCHYNLTDLETVA